MKVKRPIYTEATELEVRKRLHPWAITELTNEALNGFPLIGRMPRASAFCDMASLYEGQRRAEFVRAFLENPYFSVLKSEGRQKSAFAEEVLKKLQERHNFTMATTPITQSLNPKATAEAENYFKDPEPFNLPRQNMVGAVRELIVSMNLGTKVKAGEGDTVGFDYYYGKWRVYTGVIIRAGKTNHMDFAHCVYDENGARLLVSSYPRIVCVGIDSWDLLRKVDLPEAVETLGLLTKKFYEAVPTIVDGLPQDYRTDL